MYPYIPSALPPLVRQILSQHGQVYNRQCIADAKCGDQERIAAAYDYVGAVYGDSLESRYDHVLTPAERKYAEGKFGKITQASAIPLLLAGGQEEFFKKHSLPFPAAHCSRADWGAVAGFSEFFGTGLALGGSHNCGREFGRLFLKLGWEQEIASNPILWIFFIESSEVLQEQMKAGNALQEELALFHRIAERLGIPAENPITTIVSEPVLQGMEKKGVSREELAVVMVLKSYLTTFFSLPEIRADIQSMSEREQMEAVHLVLHAIFVAREEPYPTADAYLRTLGVEEEKFYAACKAFLTPGPNEDLSLFMLAKLQTINLRFRELADISNQLSITRVQDKIKSSGTKHAFFQMGGAHLPIVEKIYPGGKVVSVGSLLQSDGLEK